MPRRVGVQIGETIAGKYRLVRLIGQGSFAEVYEALHDQIGQRVAIKILRPEHAEVQEVAQRFLTEGRAASAAGHPGIVQIFDLGRLPSGEPYLVMEYLQGDDLHQIMAREGKLKPEHAIGVCLHILDALAAAHAAGVIHRDLKPENVVLVRGPGGEPWAKVVDFGIARVTNRDGPEVARLTAVGVLLGTPYYVAPEQARGAQEIDARVDIYAVGAMLYEMLTGRVPFGGSSVTEIIVKVLTDPFPSPREVDPTISPELEAVIRRATNRNLDVRYGSAAEFSRALRELLDKPGGMRVSLPAHFAPQETTGIRRIRELASQRPEQRATPASVGRSSPGAAVLAGGVGSVATRTTMRPPTVRRARPILFAVVGACALAVLATVLLLVSSQSGTTMGSGAPGAPPRVDDRDGRAVEERGQAPGSDAGRLPAPAPSTGPEKPVDGATPAIPDGGTPSGPDKVVDAVAPAVPDGGPEDVATEPIAEAADVVVDDGGREGPRRRDGGVRRETGGGQDADGLGIRTQR